MINDTVLNWNISDITICEMSNFRYRDRALESYSCTCYQTVDDIPQEIIETFGLDKSSYLSREFLSVLERYNGESIEFFYLLIKDGSRPIAIVNLQLLNLSLETIEKNSAHPDCLFQKIGLKLANISSDSPAKLLICGNPFVTGEHGIVKLDNIDSDMLYKSITQSITQLLRTDWFKDRAVDGVVFKDFSAESLTELNILKKFDYHAFNADDNMVLYIDKNWRDFSDYLASLKTKFRTKAKRTLKLSEELTIKELSADDIRELQNDMQLLYKSVKDRAKFSLEDISIDTYIGLKETLKDNFRVRGYWLNSKLVGFMSGMICSNNFDAHFVGIDYDYNREYAVYQRMLYDYVDIAISEKLHKINYGRTAGEIKSSIGAVPEELTLFIKHPRLLPNRLFAPFINSIKPTEFSTRKPFKVSN